MRISAAKLPGCIYPSTGIYLLISFTKAVFYKEPTLIHIYSTRTKEFFFPLPKDDVSQLWYHRFSEAGTCCHRLYKVSSPLRYQTPCTYIYASRRLEIKHSISNKEKHLQSFSFSSKILSLIYIITVTHDIRTATTATHTNTLFYTHISSSTTSSSSPP